MTAADKEYLRVIENILKNGEECTFRNQKHSNLSIFGERMVFNLENGEFPLFTVRKVFWKGVVEELLWFIRGSTNVYELSNKGVNFWNNNANTAINNDLGPIYGFQWRHFGATYKTMYDDYSNEKSGGIDQLQNLIYNLKNKSSDRRAVLLSWNPKDLDKMILPPCHMFAQFYISDNLTKLNCQVYQRSCDAVLGIPFNIASYALLTCILADLTGLKPKKLIHVSGNFHIYTNHIENLKKLINLTTATTTTITNFDEEKIVKLNIKKKKRKNIEDYSFEDFELINYVICNEEEKSLLKFEMVL